jgi:hypothetical protein
MEFVNTIDEKRTMFKQFEQSILGKREITRGGRYIYIYVYRVFPSLGWTMCSHMQRFLSDNQENVRLCRRPSLSIPLII